MEDILVEVVWDLAIMVQRADLGGKKESCEFVCSGGAAR